MKVASSLRLAAFWSATAAGAEVFWKTTYRAPRLPDPGELGRVVDRAPRHLVEREVDAARFGELDAAQSRRRRAERSRVVHERDDRCPLAVVLGDPFQRDAELVAVAGGDQEVVGRLSRVAQDVRERRRTEGDLVFGDAQPERFRVPRPPPHERHHTLGHKLAVQLLGAVHLVGVVLVDQLDRPPFDPALCVHPVDVTSHAVGVVGADVRGGSGEVEDRADFDGVVGSSVPPVAAAGCGEGEEGGGEEAERPGGVASGHGVVPVRFAG